MSASNSLINRLAAGVVFINLFVYALVGLSIYQSRQQYEHRVALSTQNLAHSLEISIGGILDKMDVTLFALSKEVERQQVGGGINGKSLNAYIAQLHKQIPEFEQMWVADEEGNVRFGTDIPASKPINITDREYFHRLYENPAPGLVISKPVIGRITKTWSVLICRRINHPDGSLAGVAFGSLRAVDYFTKMFSAMNIGKHGIISLRDEGLSLIAQTPPGQVGSRVVSAKTLEIIRANPNSHTYTTLTKQDNIERTISYQKVTHYPFYIFVAQSKYEYLSPWRKEVAITLPLLTLFTLFTLFSAWMINKRTSEMLTMHDLELDRANLEVMVKERTADLAKAKDSAEAANRAKSTFLANMSHEIRTPMNSVLGFAQLLQRDPTLTPQARHRVATIMSSGEHLLSIINDILEMSRIEAGRVELHNNSFDLHDLLEGLAVMFRQRAEEKGLTFNLDNVQGLPRFIEADPSKLRQILINLLGNAVKFTSQGQITMRALIAGNGRIAIEVSDTGIGISPSDQEKLFRPFERTRSGEQAAGGTGLGLAISREYAHLMGGEITVESQEGKGSCFRIEIPVPLYAEAPIAVSASGTPPRVITLVPDQGEIRVLVVDDHSPNRELLRGMLEPLGFIMYEACSGEEAVAKAKLLAPRIILMDLIMPGMDGAEATRLIRGSFAKELLAIIGISASALETERQRFLEAGANTFIAKPFREQELYDALACHAGVLFNCEKAEESSGTLQSAEISTLQKMPPEWCEAFRQAITSRNITRLRKLAQEARGIDPVLSAFLLEKAEQYDFDGLKGLYNALEQGQS